MQDVWDEEIAASYDTPGTGMFSPELLGPTIERLADLAGDGRALEFAIGTERVAVPLALAHDTGRSMAWRLIGS